MQEGTAAAAAVLMQQRAEAAVPGSGKRKGAAAPLNPIRRAPPRVQLENL